MNNISCTNTSRYNTTQYKSSSPRRKTILNRQPKQCIQCPNKQNRSNSNRNHYQNKKKNTSNHITHISSPFHQLKLTTIRKSIIHHMLQIHRNTIIPIRLSIPTNRHRPLDSRKLIKRPQIQIISTYIRISIKILRCTLLSTYQRRSNKIFQITSNVLNVNTLTAIPEMIHAIIRTVFHVKKQLITKIINPNNSLPNHLRNIQIHQIFSSQ